MQENPTSIPPQKVGTSNSIRIGNKFARVGGSGVIEIFKPSANQRGATIRTATLEVSSGFPIQAKIYLAAITQQTPPPTLEDSRVIVGYVSAAANVGGSMIVPYEVELPPNLGLSVFVQAGEGFATITWDFSEW